MYLHNDRLWYQAAIDDDLYGLKANANIFLKYHNKEDHEYTALIYAAECNRKECVAYLSRFECSLVSKTKETALMVAALNGAEACIPYLRSELRMKAQDGWTALHEACNQNSLECAKYLVDEWDIADKQGKTPLQLAKEMENQLIVNLLIDYSKTKCFPVCSVSDWYVALRCGYLEAIKQNYELYKAQRTENGESALHIVATFNHKECVFFLASFEIELTDANGRTALMCAAERNSVDCIQYLLEQQFKIDSKGCCALHYAAMNNCTESIHLLKEEIGIVDNEGKTSLIHAVLNNSIDCIQHLQEIKKQDQDGNCALHHACIAGFSECVKLLLEEISITNKVNKTPLQVAQEEKQRDCISVIKDYQKSKVIPIKSDDEWFSAAKCGYAQAIQQYSKSHLLKKTTNGETALMLAAQNNHKECVEYLARFEAGQVDKEGKTALIHAAIKNSFECIPLLQKEFQKRDAKGQCALHHACLNNSINSVKLLLEEAEIINNDGKTPLQSTKDISFMSSSMKSLTLSKKQGLSQCQQIIQKYLQTREWFDATNSGKVTYVRRVAVDSGLSYVKNQIYKFQKSQNEFGQTALMLAVLKKHLPMVEFLAAFELGVSDDCGKTALMYATLNNLHQFIPLLTQELKMTDKQGRTSLYYACQLGYLECAKLLLIEAPIPDSCDVTPLKIARKCKKQGCVQLLEEYVEASFVKKCQENEKLQEEIKEMQGRIVALQQQQLATNFQVADVLLNCGGFQ